LALLIPLLLVSIADSGMNSAVLRFSAMLRSKGDHYGANRTIRLGFLLKVSEVQPPSRFATATRVQSHSSF
jgi:hypothetical protein